METQKMIQVIESCLNILMNELNDEEYRMFIETTPLLREYDSLMANNEENIISEELLLEVLQIVKPRVNSL